MNDEVLLARWREIKDRPLLAGGHSPDSQMCVMEAVAYVAGEEWTDSPKCASPVIAQFLRSWNDALSDEDRQRLKPYISKVIGTAASTEAEERRAWIVTDWLSRTLAPAFLRLAGLESEADSIERGPQLLGPSDAEALQPVLNAAGDAARDAARDAAWNAARAAAWAAAGDAARDAAWDAARDAAGDAAGVAARDHLAPTVKLMQASAFDLLNYLIEVSISA